MMQSETPPINFDPSKSFDLMSKDMQEIVRPFHANGRTKSRRSQSAPASPMAKSIASTYFSVTPPLPPRSYPPSPAREEPAKTEQKYDFSKQPAQFQDVDLSDTKVTQDKPKIKKTFNNWHKTILLSKGIDISMDLYNAYHELDFTNLVTDSAHFLSITFGFTYFPMVASIASIGANWHTQGPIEILSTAAIAGSFLTLFGTPISWLPTALIALNAASVAANIYQEDYNNALEHLALATTTIHNIPVEEILTFFTLYQTTFNAYETFQKISGNQYYENQIRSYDTYIKKSSQFPFSLFLDDAKYEKQKLLFQQNWKEQKIKEQYDSCKDNAQLEINMLIREGLSSSSLEEKKKELFQTCEDIINSNEDVVMSAAGEQVKEKAEL